MHSEGEQKGIFLDDFHSWSSSALSLVPTAFKGRETARELSQLCDKLAAYGLTVAQESVHTCARVLGEASGAPVRYKTHQSQGQPAEDLRVIAWREGRNSLFVKIYFDELQGNECEAS